MSTLQCAHGDLVQCWAFSSFMSLRFAWEVKAPQESCILCCSARHYHQVRMSFFVNLAVFRGTDLPETSYGFLLLGSHRLAIKMASPDTLHQIYSWSAPMQCNAVVAQECPWL